MAQLSIQQAFDLAMRHHQAGRLQEAEQLYRQVLAQQPEHAVALHHLGLIARQLGRNDVAVDLIRRAIAQRSNYAEAHYNLGNALKDGGELDEAIIAYRQAIALKPNFAEAQSNLGIAQKDKGQLNEAIAAFRQAIGLRPTYAEAHYNLGNALKDKVQLDEAITAYRQAIALKPDLSEAHSNLGIALKDKGQVDEAIAAHRQAIALQPNYAEAHSNLGVALADKGQLDDAIAAFRQAIALDPKFPEAHNNLGVALKDKGQLDEANAAYRQAIALKPNYAEAHSNLVYTLYFDGHCSQGQLLAEHRAWNQRHAKPLAKFIRPHANDRSPERRLRIGYVSAYFYSQAEAYFVLPLLEAHDHEQFEIHCYANVVRPDEITSRHRRAADVWHDVLSDSHAELAERIAADRIDVLVDLTMHMAGSRLLTFARKPAPVQVAWLAYPGSTGLDAMDYRITDRYMDPQDSQPPCYSERSVRLADCWCCYDPLTDVPRAAPRDGSAVTFGSINNPCKLNEPLLRLWAGAMLAIDNSRLLVQTISPEHSARITEWMGRMGIGADRLDFVGRQPRAEYLRLYDRIDLGLDPLPYNGITTTLDALWMGVPVVSLAGQRRQPDGAEHFDKRRPWRVGRPNAGGILEDRHGPGPRFRSPRRIAFNLAPAIGLLAADGFQTFRRQYGIGLSPDVARLVFNRRVTKAQTLPKSTASKPF